ncbi:AGC/Akt protein kinase [Sanghuangporus baumii]|uniref:non-specific serine/threonine protein kinase n=1 Tax=Sanghuangporus baumii TaxID=108892 RepID=A0A9Q5NBW3_SANBA|nr:AGC/Akt protein kinase [Sanghuangporus baumii]
MSFARAVSKQIARSIRNSRVKPTFTLLDDIDNPRHYLCNNNSRITMQSSNDNSTLGFHHAIARDVSSVFKAYERDECAEGVRNEAFERLRRLVQAMGNSGEYDLVDVSFGSLPNSPQFYHAPLECAIIDKTRPDGLPSSYGNATLPVAYDSITLAKHLLENGYNGTFVDTRPDLVGFDAADFEALSSRPIPPVEPAWGQFSTPFSLLFNVLPPSLRIKPGNLDHPEILLSPAHPSNVLRWNLIKHTCESNEALSLLSSFFWLWLRSHGVEHYSWTTCVFMVMFYLQDRYKAAEMLNPDGQELQVPLQQFWNRIEHSIPQYERTSIPLLPRMANPADHPGKLIDDFFSFWAGNKYLAYSRVLDPLTGLHILRSQKYSANTTHLDEALVMQELRNKSAKGSKNAFWAYQPLVVVDPFLSSHNLAHTVTKHALQHMIHKARISARTLKRGLPLAEVLGSEAPPPPLTSLAVQDIRALLVEWQEQSASSSQTVASGSGTATQRMYHTTARVEAKGNKVIVFRAIRAITYAMVSRDRTIKRVERIIRERFGKQYLVECFGSTQYGVDSPTSDLDLVVLDQDRKTGFAPEVKLGTLPGIYNVRRLADTLERHGFRINRTIAHATVPIVKFEDTRTRLNCDININDRLGLYNTRLIAQYCSLSPLLRPLLMLLKQWAKTLGLNDPSGEGGAATFSSYALTLMTIGFLQTHDLLPNLQADLPLLKPQEAFWICSKDDERTLCDPRYNLSPSWTPQTNIAIQDLRGALTAWFRFWAHQYNYAHDVMSIRDGGVIPRVERSQSTKGSDKQALNRRKKSERREKLEKKAAEKAARKAYHVMQYRKKRGLPVEGEGTEGVIEGDNAKAVSGSEAESENGEEEDADAVVGDADEAALEEMDQADVQQGRQPRSWARAALVVADPFIVAKNTTGQITPIALQHFTAECKRSLLLLSSGADFEDLLGDGSAIWRYSRKKKGFAWRGMNKLVMKQRGRQRWDREKKEKKKEKSQTCRSEKWNVKDERGVNLLTAVIPPQARDEDLRRLETSRATGTNVQAPGVVVDEARMLVVVEKEEEAAEHSGWDAAERREGGRSEVICFVKNLRAPNLNPARKAENKSVLFLYLAVTITILKADIASFILEIIGIKHQTSECKVKPDGDPLRGKSAQMTILSGMCSFKMGDVPPPSSAPSAARDDSAHDRKSAKMSSWKLGSKKKESKDVSMSTSRSTTPIPSRPTTPRPPHNIENHSVNSSANFRSGMLTVVIFSGRGLSLPPGAIVPDVIQRALRSAPERQPQPRSNRDSMQRKRHWWLPYVVLEFDKNEILIDALDGDLSSPIWNHRAHFDVSRTSNIIVSAYLRTTQCVQGHDDMGNDLLMGRVEISPMLDGKALHVSDQWYVAAAGSGEFHLQIGFKPSAQSLTIEAFELLKVIGKGSFGKVMQVRKKDTQRVYALKTIRKAHIASRPGEITHILAERTVLALVNNPFIVPLKFSFQNPDKLYLVMSFVNGGELFYHLQREGKFDENRSRFYAAELLCALEHLHGFNVVYRDLKPENILLDFTGHIALCDFGLCKLNMSETEKTNTFCGTPEYIAPELLESQGYTKTVDWWTLGVLLFEMMTGLPPFYDENVNVMYQRILRDPLLFPPDMSHDAKSVMSGLLQRDPSKRLGHNGADEIKRHPFFARHVDWNLLLAKKIQPPFKPSVESVMDVANFDSEFTSETATDSVVLDSQLSETVQDQFRGFTYNPDSEHLSASVSNY